MTARSDAWSGTQPQPRPAPESNTGPPRSLVLIFMDCLRVRWMDDPRVRARACRYSAAVALDERTAANLGLDPHRCAPQPQLRPLPPPPVGTMATGPPRSFVLIFMEFSSGFQ